MWITCMPYHSSTAAVRRLRGPSEHGTNDYKQKKPWQEKMPRFAGNQYKYRVYDSFGAHLLLKGCSSVVCCFLVHYLGPPWPCCCTPQWWPRGINTRQRLT